MAAEREPSPAADPEEQPGKVTMLWPPYTQQWAGLLRDDGWWR